MNVLSMSINSPVGNNSTVTPTTSFTGKREENDEPEVMVSCFSDDQDGTLFFDFSVNGTDWRTFPSGGFDVTAGIHEFHTAVKGPRSFRIRWSSSSQPTTLQIFTYYGVFRTPNAPLNQPYGLDADSILVRPSWTWLDANRGLVSGMLTYKKFGRVINTAAGTYVPVAIGGIYRTPQSGSATTLRVKAGGHADDTANGTGAREVTVTVLDENFDLQTEAIATAGASASSATTVTATRLMFIEVTASGTYATQSAGSHTNAIVIENGGGGTDWGTIDATDFPKGRSEIGFFSCPRNYTAHVFLTDYSFDTGKEVDLIFFSREGIDETAAPYSAMQARSVNIGLAGGDIKRPGGGNIPFGPFTGPCDFGFMMNPNTNPADGTVEFEIFLLPV